MSALSFSLCAVGLVIGCGTGACSKTIDDRGSSEVDFSNPKRVVSSIFYAAQTGQSTHLAGLCAPSGLSNRHVQRICTQRPDAPDWDNFVKQFAKGRLIGEARISGNRALVNFVFGETGTDTETMELVLLQHRWHLVAF